MSKELFIERKLLSSCPLSTRYFLNKLNNCVRVWGYVTRSRLIGQVQELEKPYRLEDLCKLQQGGQGQGRELQAQQHREQGSGPVYRESSPVDKIKSGHSSDSSTPVPMIYFIHDIQYKLTLRQCSHDRRTLGNRNGYMYLNSFLMSTGTHHGGQWM